MMRRWLGSCQQAQTGSPRLADENLYKVVCRPAGRLRNMQCSWGLLHLPIGDGIAVTFWRYLKLRRVKGRTNLSRSWSIFLWLAACLYTCVCTLTHVRERRVFRKDVKPGTTGKNTWRVKWSSSNYVFGTWSWPGWGMQKSSRWWTVEARLLELCCPVCIHPSSQSLGNVRLFWQCWEWLSSEGVWLLAELSVILLGEACDHTLYCHSEL